MKRERHGDDLKTGRSSSSSTLNNDGDAFPEPTPKLDERSPLLKFRNYNDGRFRPKTIYSIRAWLVYQPSRIPIINKTLPSNGCTLFILAFLCLQIFYTFYDVPLSVPMLFVFADRTALVFVANLPLLYLFAAKNQPIKFLTGKSYETLNIFHRRLGEVMCILALLHSVGMLGVWYTILQPSGLTLVKFLLSRIILLGLGALIAYEAIYFTSLGSFRQRWYELFLGLHVMLQTTSLVLLFFHHRGSRPYVAVALAIFLLDRFIYRMTLKSYTTEAALEVKEDQYTVSVRASIPLHTKITLMNWFRRHGTTRGWNATDHVFLSIPSLAKKHWIQAHPFTIASRAPKGSDTDARLELIIRAQDGFSKDLLRYAKSHKNTVVRLDGPYGSQSAVHMLHDSDLAVVIAGGSGIAVGWPLVWSILDSRRTLDGEPAIEAVGLKKVLLVWVVRRQSHLSWIDPEELENLRAAGVEVIIPPFTETHGHPDIRCCITDWIVAHDATSLMKVCIVCSGPGGMNRMARNMTSALVYEGHRVSIEVENFGW